MTRGYGPERYILPKTAASEYKVRVTITPAIRTVPAEATVFVNVTGTGATQRTQHAARDPLSMPNSKGRDHPSYLAAGGG